MAPSCGQCHACCINLRIDRLSKPEHEPCVHLRAHGCVRYRRRPVVCREFVCEWCRNGWDEALRPDLSGVLVHAVRNQVGGVGVNVVECAPGALDRMSSLVERVKQYNCMLVTLVYRDGRSRLYSRNAVWIDDLRRRNPLLSLPKKIDAIELEDG